MTDWVVHDGLLGQSKLTTATAPNSQPDACVADSGYVTKKETHTDI